MGASASIPISSHPNEPGPQGFQGPVGPAAVVFTGLTFDQSKNMAADGVVPIEATDKTLLKTLNQLLKVVNQLIDVVQSAGLAK